MYLGKYMMSKYHIFYNRMVLARFYDLIRLFILGTRFFSRKVRLLFSFNYIMEKVTYHVIHYLVYKLKLFLGILQFRFVGS